MVGGKFTIVIVSIIQEKIMNTSGLLESKS